MEELVLARDFDPSRNNDSTSTANSSGDSSRASDRQPPLRNLIAGIILLLIAALVWALVLHGTGHLANTPTETVQATATSTPVPVVLYQADWSHGLDSWTLPPDWHLVNGHIENDGNGTAPLLVPYYVTAKNYSIEADLTVQKVPSYRACHSYGIEGLNDAGQEQFIGQIACLRLGIVDHGFSENIITHADSVRDSIATNDTSVSYATRTFVIQVQHNNVVFCPGVSCLSNLNSTTPLWPMHIAIVDIGLQLTLTRLVITTP